PLKSGNDVVNAAIDPARSAPGTTDSLAQLYPAPTEMVGRYWLFDARTVAAPAFARACACATAGAAAGAAAKSPESLSASGAGSRVVDGSASTGPLAPTSRPRAALVVLSVSSAASCWRRAVDSASSASSTSARVAVPAARRSRA